MEPFCLIVGLGNPGRQYARTRHNAGFRVVERLAKRWQADWATENKFRARVARVQREGRKMLLALPETFMNACGEAVGALAAFHRIPPDRVWAVVDDADLQLGELRLRARGSSGGHHGLESIEQHLGTRGFPRLRVGIGRDDPASREITDYVLSRFGPVEVELLAKVVERACDQIECWLREGLAQAMNRFNGAVAP